MLYLYEVNSPFSQKWRGEGKQIMMHLDDGIGVHIDLQVCKTLSDEVRQDLILSGLVFNTTNFIL